MRASTKAWITDYLHDEYLNEDTFITNCLMSGNYETAINIQESNKQIDDYLKQCRKDVRALLIQVCVKRTTNSIGAITRGLIWCDRSTAQRYIKKFYTAVGKITGIIYYDPTE